MSILQQNLDDIPDLHTVPEDEYEVRIKHAELKKSQSGAPMLSVVLEVVDDPEAYDVYQNIMIANDQDDRKKYDAKRRRLRDFYDCFGIDYSTGEVDLNEIVGNTGWVVLREREETDDYPARNEVKRWSKSS